LEYGAIERVRHLKRKVNFRTGIKWFGFQ